MNLQIRKSANLRISLLLSVALACSACTPSHAVRVKGALPDRSSTEVNQQRLEALLASRQSANPNSESEYLLAPGDVLSVTIYSYRPGGGDFTTDVRVDDYGYVSLPVTEPVRAMGRNLAQVREDLIEALRRANVMKNPMLNVFLKDFAGQRIVILGAVNRPGTYNLSRGGEKLIDIMSAAGGVSAGAGNYLLFRPASAEASPGSDPLVQGYTLNKVAAMDFTPEGNTVVIPLDERVSHRAPALVSLPVRGGDLIIVPPAGQVFVEGEVGKSGLYDLRHRMTLTQLLATAGGLRFPANQKKVTLVREARGEGDETTHWLVDVNRIQSQEQPDVLLEPNDRIVVPARPGRKVVYTVYQAALAVIRISVGGAVALF